MSFPSLLSANFVSVTNYLTACSCVHKFAWCRIRTVVRLLTVVNFVWVRDLVYGQME